MSFAEEVRKELAELPIKLPCCRRAELCGIFLDAEILPEKRLAACFSNPTVSARAEELIRLQYGVTPEVRQEGRYGRVYDSFTFTSPAAVRLQRQIGQADAFPEKTVGFAGPHCRAAFLRGVFLAHGTVSDPHRSFHLEFCFTKPASADFFVRFLRETDYEPKVIERKNGIGVYFKESGTVEDLVALAGSHHVIFEIINSRIEREIRGNENRATNCDAKNIGRVVAAASRQVKAIEKLYTSGKISQLPEPIRETAKLRLEHPDIGLEELRGLHDPAISKSGLNHRLKKILEAAEEV